VEFYEAAAGGTDRVILRAPAAVAADVTFDLPGADGSDGHILKTNGAGALSFTGTLAALTITALTAGGISIPDEGLLKLYEPSGSGTNFSAFKAQAQTVDITYTLPPAVVASAFLQTDASGNLVWTTSTATLQSAYTAGEDITLAAGKVMNWGQANNEGILTLTKTGTGAGVVLALDDDDTGGCLTLKQDGIAKALYIDQNTAAISVDIDAGDATAVVVDQPNNQSILDLNKTGSGAGDVVDIDNDGTGRGIFIDQDGNGTALEIDHDGTGQSLIINNAAGVSAVQVTQAGNAAALELTKSGAGAGAVIDIGNSGTGVDIDGSGSNWSIRSGGGIHLQGIEYDYEVMTISSDTITVDADNCYLRLRGEGSANDNLYTISGGTDGQILIIQADDASTYGQISLRQHATLSNIRIPTDPLTLNNQTDCVTLVFRDGIGPSSAGVWCAAGIEIGNGNP
jgi:hypothetical protein